MCNVDMIAWLSNNWNYSINVLNNQTNLAFEIIKRGWLQSCKYTTQILYFNNHIKELAERLITYGRLRVEQWCPDAKTPPANHHSWPQKKILEEKEKREKKK